MIELTEAQRQAVLNGEAVRLSLPGVSGNLVLLREDQYEKLRELQDDEALQEAWLDAVEEVRGECALESS
jgi:hypothetical protein